MSSPPLPPKRNFKNRIGGFSQQHYPLSAALPTATATGTVSAVAGAGLNVARRLSLDRQQDMQDLQGWEDSEETEEKERQSFYRREREEDEILIHKNNNNNHKNDNRNHHSGNNRYNNNNNSNNNDNNNREAHAEDPATLSARSRPPSSSSASVSVSPQEKPLPQTRNAPPSLPPRTAHHHLNGAAALDERLAQSRLSAQQLAQHNPFALNEIDEEIYDFPLLHLSPDIFIGTGVEVRGDFQYEGLLRLDGKFQGRFAVTTRADLVVGPQGVFIGELSPSVQRVWVDGGRIVGRVCVEQLFLTGKAQIKGDIRCRVLQIFGGEVEICGGMTVRADLDLAHEVLSPSPQAAQKKDSHTHTREEVREKEKEEKRDPHREKSQESVKDVEASIESARAEKLAAKQRRREAKQMGKEDELVSTTTTTSPVKESNANEREPIPHDVAADQNKENEENAVGDNTKTDNDRQHHNTNNNNKSNSNNNNDIASDVSEHTQSEHHTDDKAQEGKNLVASPPKTTSSTAADKQKHTARDRATKESLPVTSHGSSPTRDDNKETPSKEQEKEHDTNGASSPAARTDEEEENNANSGWKIVTDKNPSPASPRAGGDEKQQRGDEEEGKSERIVEETHAKDESNVERGDDVSADTTHAHAEKSSNEAERANDDPEDDVNLEDSLDRSRQKTE